MYNFKSNSKCKDILRNNIPFITCFISALLTISICSKSSPLYPLNDWVDSNCYFTVGKSIIKGLVPYRDLIEQKGPFLYFIHAFASLISYKSFFGVYLLEVISATFFLYFSFKILELFCGKNSLYIIPLVAYVVFRCKAFAHGDSAEEFCFPFLSYVLYNGLKTVRTQQYSTYLEYCLIGVFASIVFWTKFTLCGIFVGWFIPLAIHFIIKKQPVFLLKIILLIILGLIIGTIPFLLYFGFNHAIKEWLYVYIYENIFKYSVVESNTNFVIQSVRHLFDGFSLTLRYYRLGLLLLGIGSIYCLLRKWFSEFVYTASMLFTTFFFAFIGGVTTLIYYTLIISPFVCLGLIPIFSAISSDNEKNHLFKNWHAIGLIIVFILIYINTPNQYLMHYKKNELPQYKFAEIINKEPNATLLNYGFLDGGFYTTTGIVPNCKVFCLINMPGDELINLQKQYVNDGVCDFIVTRDYELEIIDSRASYNRISSCDFYFEESMHTYYLYKRNSVTN